MVSSRTVGAVVIRGVLGDDMEAVMGCGGHNARRKLTEERLATKDTGRKDAGVWSSHVFDPTLIRLAATDDPAAAVARLPSASQTQGRWRSELLASVL